MNKKIDDKVWIVELDGSLFSAIIDGISIRKQCYGYRNISAHIDAYGEIKEDRVFDTIDLAQKYRNDTYNKKTLKKKGNMQGGFDQIISKDDLLPLKDKSIPHIVKALNSSIYMVKKSLVYHDLFTGVIYKIVCKYCQQQFNSFTDDVIFCSNNCKHKGQHIWNRGLTKENSDILMNVSEQMKGNNRWGKADVRKRNREILFLPKLQKEITYDKSSNLEKEWLLLCDATIGIKDIYVPDFHIDYINELKIQQRYFPDYIVEWETGLKWLVEVKGEFNDDMYNKIEHTIDWCSDNGYDYRLITMGLVRRNTWSTVYAYPNKVIRPSKEVIMMTHAVVWSVLSSSSRKKVGAIICTQDKNNLLSVGYNGDEAGGSNIAISNSPGCEGFIHAEENALIKLKSNESAILFCTDMPCVSCAKKIINAKNIKEVFYLRSYRDASGVGLLIKNKIPTYRFEYQSYSGRSFSEEQTFEMLLPGGVKEIYLDENKI